MNDMNLFNLESVGSVADLEQGLVYPMLEDGSPDFECGVDFLELSDEWCESLSEEDEITFNKILFHKYWKNKF